MDLGRVSHILEIALQSNQYKVPLPENSCIKLLRRKLFLSIGKPILLD
jgi:hypothetical protein